MKDAHRIQALGVLLLAVFGWLVFDLSSVRAGVRTFLEAAVRAEAEPKAPTRPPILIGHGKKTPIASLPSGAAALSGGCGGCVGVRTPAGVLIDQRGGRNIHVTTLVAPDTRPTLKRLDQVARALNLSDRQKDEFRRILEDAARELDDLRFLPNEDGQTWHGIVADAARVGWGRDRTLGFALNDFVDTSLHGRGASYRHEQAQIVKRYTGRLRVQLDPEQQHDLDKYSVAPLIDPRGLPRSMRPMLGTLIKTTKAHVRIS